MSEIWTVVVAVQVALGLIGALVWLACFARPWLVGLERRFSGWRRVGVGLSLSIVGVTCVLSTVIVGRVPWAPFVLATVAVGITLCAIGGQLVIWAPFGGYTKNAGREEHGVETDE